jgi:hypothetical protein
MKHEWYIQSALDMLAEDNPLWAARIQHELQESQSLQQYLKSLIYLVENTTEERCSGK